jgi:hypothetical protein
MDPLRYPDWQCEDVSELGIRRPCRVPHDVLDGLHVSRDGLPQGRWVLITSGNPLHGGGVDHPPGHSASPRRVNAKSADTGVVVEA